jgi:5'-deoxynucleotidase YfbR-like HD superfamily hydrolase
VKLEPATLDPRRAGQVTRYHTWPRLREQSVGEHSWQVARVLLAIWPAAPRRLLVHCVTHDIGETVAGDPPYPVKALNPDLKTACDRIEGAAHDMMAMTWMLPVRLALPEHERAAFKLAEFIEMWEWGLFELSMGNSNAALVVSRCADGVAHYVDAISSMDDGTLPVDVDNLLRRTEQYMQLRRQESENAGVSQTSAGDS